MIASVGLPWLKRWLCAPNRRLSHLCQTNLLTEHLLYKACKPLDSIANLNIRRSIHLTIAGGGDNFMGNPGSFFQALKRTLRLDSPNIICETVTSLCTQNVALS